LRVGIAEKTYVELFSDRSLFGSVQNGRQGMACRVN